MAAAGTEERTVRLWDCGTGNVCWCWYLGGTAGLGWATILYQQQTESWPGHTRDEEAGDNNGRAEDNYHHYLCTRYDECLAGYIDVIEVLWCLV